MEHVLRLALAKRFQMSLARWERPASVPLLLSRFQTPPSPAPE